MNGYDGSSNFAGSHPQPLPREGQEFFEGCAPAVLALKLPGIKRVRGKVSNPFKTKSPSPGRGWGWGLAKLDKKIEVFPK